MVFEFAFAGVGFLTALHLVSEVVDVVVEDEDKVRRVERMVTDDDDGKTVGGEGEEEEDDDEIQIGESKLPMEEVDVVEVVRLLLRNRVTIIDESELESSIFAFRKL